MHWPVYALACICIGLDNVTGYWVVSDYAIAYANVYAIGYANINFGITQGIACYVDFTIGFKMDIP